MTPHSEIDTVFLDVGNTLISIDFDWVASEVAARGVPATAEELRRAEAAARPSYSQQLFVDGVEPGTDLFRFYLATILERHTPAAELSPASFDVLVTDLRQVLRPDGRASVLWRSVMPGVREALAHMRDLGLRLVVVSNSDGTVARSLEEAGLLACMAAVVDSALAGFEKPDPRIFEAALERSGADRARNPRRRSLSRRCARRAWRRPARCAPRSVRRLGGRGLRAATRPAGGCAVAVPRVEVTEGTEGTVLTQRNGETETNGEI